MYCQVFLIGRCVKVAKCLKNIGNFNLARTSYNTFNEAEGIIKQPTSCRNFSSTNVSPNDTLLKEKLLNSLKNIRSSNNTNHFCGLLLEASLIFDYPNRSGKHSDWRVYKVNKIFDQLKKVVTENKPESIIAGRLVEGIYGLLPGDYSHKAEELLPFLFEIGNTETSHLKFENSEEYLKHLLKALEPHFIAAEELNDLFPRFSSEDFPHNLEVIRSYLHHSAKTTANKLLDLIFDIGQTHSVFSTDEKLLIGNLMIDAIEPIKECIEDVQNFLSCSKFSALRKRSALQLLIDEYAKFPALNKCLLIEFYRGKFYNSIEILNDIIAETFDSDFYDSDQDSEYTVFPHTSYVEYRDGYVSQEKERYFARMPETHTWWKKPDKYF